MKDILQIFRHEQFGEIRVILIANKPWFVGIDIARALKYVDAYGAIRKNVDPEDKQLIKDKSEFARLGGKSLNKFHGFTVINESGLYSLILSSRLKSARAFKHWVTSEVLPSLSRLGIYTTSQVIDKLFESAQAGELIRDLKSVYVFEMDNDTVKIGYTKNIRQRMQTISSSSGLAITNGYSTEFVDSEIAYLIEQTCHEIFDDRRVRGEFFKVPFAEAVEVLQKLFAEQA